MLAGLARAIVGSAGLRLAGMGFGFLVGIQLARGLGVEGYGIYGLAMSWLSMGGLIAEFGITHLGTREIAAALPSNRWDRINFVVRWCLRSVMGLGVLVTLTGLVVLWLIGDLIPQPVRIALLSGLLLIPMTALGNLGGGLLRGMHKVVAGQLPEFVLRPALFSLGLALALLWQGQITVSAAMWMSTAAAALSAAAAFWLLHQAKEGQTRFVASAQEVACNWGSAWPMALTEAVRVLNGNVAVLILGAMGSAAQVGWFRVALSISVLLAMPLSLVHIVVAPMFARLHASADRVNLQRLLGWTSVLMTAGVMAMLVPFVVWGNVLLRWLFGAGFEGSYPALLVLCTGVLASALFGAAPILLNMVGQERRVARGYGVSMIALAAFTVMLVPFWAEMGAAVATSLAGTLGAALMWRDAHRIVRLDTSILGCFQSPATPSDHS